MRANSNALRRGKTMTVSPVILNARDARAYCGNISRACWYVWTTEGLLPKPTKVKTQNYYLVTELDEALSRLGFGKQEVS